MNFLGLGGKKDWQLMIKIRQENYTFVTNNRIGFSNLYAREDLHAGSVIIVPNVMLSRQGELFLAAMRQIGYRDLTNVVLELTFDHNVPVRREYLYPAL